MPGDGSAPRDRGARPGWMTALAAFCLGTVLFLVPRDLFFAETRDVEVWFGFEVHGVVALLTAPLLEGYLSSALCHLGNISYHSPQQKIRGVPAIERNEVSKASFQRMAEHLRKNEIEEGMQFGSYLAFDPDAERFPDDEVANALLTRDYRAPFLIREEV